MEEQAGWERPPRHVGAGPHVARGGVRWSTSLGHVARWYSVGKAIALREWQ